MHPSGSNPWIPSPRNQHLHSGCLASDPPFKGVHKVCKQNPPGLFISVILAYASLRLPTRARSYRKVSCLDHHREQQT